MYALYKVNVWIRADIDKGTPIQTVLENIKDIPYNKVGFVEDETYLTETEVFIIPELEPTLFIYGDNNEIIYKNLK